MEFGFEGSFGLPASQLFRAGRSGQAPEQQCIPRGTKPFKPASEYVKSKHEFTSSELVFTKSEDEFTQSELVFPKSEQQFTQSEHEYRKSELEFRNLEQQFTQSEHEFRKSEQQFTSSELEYVKSELEFTQSILVLTFYMLVCWLDRESRPKRTLRPLSG